MATTTTSLPKVIASHTVVLRKESQRQLQGVKIKNQIESLANSLMNQGRIRRGWSADIVPNFGNSRGEFWRQDILSSGYAYTVAISFKCAGKERSKRDLNNEFENILRNLADRAPRLQYGKWNVDEVDGNTLEQALGARQAEAARSGQADVGYAPLRVPESWPRYFSHLYGLEPHIERIRRALVAGAVSDWRNRYHCALIGPPGCGKSDICQSIKKALGEEAVMEFDATSTTMAGAQKELSDRPELPRVLLVEEIEKAESALSWLLSVLDLRGEIRKTTARGNILRDTKMLAVATVNDGTLFRKINAGALASRFANTIYFRRPSRELLEKIVQREIERIDGDPDWAKPTLDYCQKHRITDPREVIAIAMCGREMLLTGEYQQILEETALDEEEVI